jgi:hypothetical protein
MSYQSIDAGATERFFTVVAKASGDPITGGTVNYYLKSKSGDNAGKWWRDSDQTWQVAETANAMTHDADGHWEIDLSESPFTAGVRYLEYTKESGDLHIPDSRHLIAAAVTSPTVVVSSTAVAAIAANESGRLTIVRHTTFSVQITGLGSLADRSKIYLSIKRTTAKSDNEAIVRISDTIGLERVNGGSVIDPTGGSLTVDDEDDGDITVDMDPAATPLVPLFDDIPYDIKIVRTNGRVDVLTSVDYPAGATTRARCLDPVTHAIT